MHGVCAVRVCPVQVILMIVTNGLLTALVGAWASLQFKWLQVRPRPQQLLHAASCLPSSRPHASLTPPASSRPQLQYPGVAIFCERAVLTASLPLAAVVQPLGLATFVPYSDLVRVSCASRAHRHAPRGARGSCPLGDLARSSTTDRMLSPPCFALPQPYYLALILLGLYYALGQPLVSSFYNVRPCRAAELQRSTAGSAATCRTPTRLTPPCAQSTTCKTCYATQGIRSPQSWTLVHRATGQGGAGRLRRRPRAGLGSRNPDARRRCPAGAASRGAAGGGVREHPLGGGSSRPGSACPTAAESRQAVAKLGGGTRPLPPASPARSLHSPVSRWPSRAVARVRGSTARCWASPCTCTG
jgi:hypothetical protein